MIVVCKCGQKNRVKALVATGGIPAKDVRCGNADCKISLRDIIAAQVDQNANIVLQIVELFTELDSEAVMTHLELLAKLGDIFVANGMQLHFEGLDDDDDEDDDEDLFADAEEEDEDDEDEEEKPKTKKKVVTKPKKPTPRNRVH
jgi:hypothetical protein